MISTIRPNAFHAPRNSYRSFSSAAPPAPPAPKSQSVKSDPTLHLPRILCLHGGGTNSRIFRAQCRVIRARLGPFFRLVFADAPFTSQPGPDVTSVYAEWEPFRSWLRPVSGAPFGLAGSEDVGTDDVQAISRCTDAAIREDNRGGATGEFIGLLGFSQGAKLAASLLLEQQIRASKGVLGKRRHAGDHLHDVEFRFAVILAGRAPLLQLNMHGREPGKAWSSKSNLLRIPTIHVHGLRDTALHLHRELLYRCCEQESTRLVEWDGDHRVPIKSNDVNVIVDEILDLVRNLDF